MSNTSKKLAEENREIRSKDEHKRVSVRQEIARLERERTVDNFEEQNRKISLLRYKLECRDMAIRAQRIAAARQYVEQPTMLI